MEMIEDGLMWGDASMSAESGKSGLDQRLVFFALNYATVEKVLAREGLHLDPQSKKQEVVSFSLAELEEKRSRLPAHAMLVEPYDPKIKSQLVEKEVLPLLREVLESDDPATKFNSLHWADFVEFFTDLVWCSQLQIPLVLDMNVLRRQIPTVARHIMQANKLKNPRPFLESLVVLERFKEVEVSYFVPQRAQSRKPLEVWNQLRTSVEFRRMATEKRSLGKSFDINGQTRVIERLAINAERAPKVNPIIAKVAGVGKAKAWVFREPEVRIQTPTVKNFIDSLIGNQYIPPIYDLPAMKAQSRYIFMPSVSAFE